MQVTFHRAMDLTPDPFEALEAIIRSGADRILTSGGELNAILRSVRIQGLVRAAEVLCNIGDRTVQTFLFPAPQSDADRAPMRQLQRLDQSQRFNCNKTA